MFMAYFIYYPGIYTDELWKTVGPRIHAHSGLGFSECKAEKLNK
jgi:hypothetical protein